jgi:4-cresol dehydrogenase (hydroxylating)
LFGHEGTVKAQVELIRKLFEPRLGKPLAFDLWKQGDPPEKSAQGVPSTFGLQCVNWYGGRGGHLSFAPVLPQDGKLALDYARKIKAYYEAIGQDYYASFTIGRRHINNVSLILYSRDDPEGVARANTLYRHLLGEAAKRGFGEYRGHISYMADVASTYDFGDGALRQLNDRVKAALDPNNIIAPGRNGIGLPGSATSREVHP